jgi:hypothetical protein
MSCAHDSHSIASIRRPPLSVHLRSKVPSYLQELLDDGIRDRVVLFNNQSQG